MANTYSQIYLQIIFAVKNRQSLIKESFRVDLEKFICSIVDNEKCKPLSIYCNPDHTHLLISKNPSVATSDIVRNVKTFSSRFVNENRLVSGHFSWQNGYGAFSYGQSQLSTIKNYIRNQPNHHKKLSFKEEYLAFLRVFEVVFDEHYLFDWIEDVS